MKKIALTSLLIVLSLPTFAADFSAATTEAEAYAIYKTEAEKFIADAKQKGATKSELKDLQAIVDKVISEYTNVDAKKIETKELTAEEKEARIEAAQEKYDAAKEAEHSAENKLLGATTMMTTGMGAMELASSMSEQKADQEAEDQMRAYLSTFYCQYGSKRVPGGTKNAEVGGGNELINLYAEYVNLANDLKARKTALDIAPGIESEEILNSATAGLHDDKSIGKRGSMFTSLARALQDPTGEDAQKWKAQQEESAKGIKDGATALGVGAIGSAVIDLAMNHIGDKDKDDEDKEEKELTDTEKSDLCRKGGLGKWNANNKTCTCVNNHATWGASLAFNSELHICTTLTDKEIGDLNKQKKKELQTCNKSASKYVWDKTKNKCVDKQKMSSGTDPKFAI